MIDQGGAQPEPVGATIGGHGAAVDDDLGAVGLTGVDVGGHLVAVDPGDQRTHVGVPGAVTGLDALRAFGDLGHQVIGDRSDGHTRARWPCSVPRPSRTRR